MAEEKHVKISVNTGALLGNFLADIQSLLDIITFVYAGLESADEELYQEHLSFMSFHPATNRKLTFEDAGKRSRQWLLTSFLTDCVNATGNFLDECRKICAVYRLGGQGKIVGQEFKDVFERDWSRFHRLGFPDKFQSLKNEFGAETQFEEHFLSLNQARNCLVHRRGVVSSRDTNEKDKLVVKWRIMQLVASPPDGNEEIPIHEPTTVEGGWSIGVKFQDRFRAFEIGQRITLQAVELYQSIFTLYSFASELVKSIEAYGVAQGVLKKPESEPAASADG